MQHCRFLQLPLAMKKYLRNTACLCLYLTLICVLPQSIVFGQSVNSGEDKAIRALVTHFYEGWNAHDVEKMISVYSDSIDHVNAFGEWHTGNQRMRKELTQFHAGPGGKNSHKTITVEKIKFIKPDVAVAIVRQISTVGNLGTFVVSKVSGKWLVESFANVPYNLPEKEAKADVKKID